VPDYDAFGREIDEDPLAKLREATVEPARAPLPAPALKAVAAAPAVAPEPKFEPPVPPRPQFVRPPRRSHRGLAAMVVLIAVVGGIGLAANSVVTKVEDGINDVIDEAVAPPPTGVQSDSLVRRANFAAALVTLRESGLGRPLSLRVAPDRIDASLIGADGRMHNVQVNPAGELRELSASPGPDAPTTAYMRIDSTAPERLTRAGATRAGVRARTINYLVLNGAKPLTWGAYFKGGEIVIGDAHGRPQRVL
jgi:hypothetical protein